MTLRIGTSEAGGTFDTQGQAIADVLNAAGGTGTAEVVQSASASIDNALRLHAGDIEFGFMAANWTGRARDASPPFTHPIELRIAAPANVGPMFFIALADSGLAKVGDLRGKRVSVGAESSGMTQHVHTIFGVLGLSFDDFTPVYLNFADGAEALAAGDVDAQFQCPIPNQVMTDLSERADVRVLALDDGERDRLVNSVPFYRPTVMKQGAFRGVDADSPQIGVFNVIATHARVPDEAVHTLVSAMIANADALGRANPLFEGLASLFEPLRTEGAQAIETGGVPLHPGARSAYRDAGYLD